MLIMADKEGRGGWTFLADIICEQPLTGGLYTLNVGVKAKRHKFNLQTIFRIMNE